MGKWGGEGKASPRRKMGWDREGTGHRRKLLVGLAADRSWVWGTASPSSGLVQHVKRPDLVSGIQQ